MDVRILGPLEVVCDGAPVALGGPRQRALLALLATRPGITVPRDRLIDELWGERVPSSAVNVVQTYVSHLRKALPAGRLVSRPPGYALHLDREELDLHRFERLAAEGREARAAGDDAAAALAFREALALWRGPALADVVALDVALPEAARLDELRLAALDERVRADLALGRHAELVPELEALVGEHPLREGFSAHLMLALYRAGRQSDALAAYREARRRLVDGLGIDPGPELRELEAAILRQEPSLDGSAPAAGAPRPRSVVVVSLDPAALDAVLTFAEPLARRARHDLVLVCLVPDAASLADASRAAGDLRAALVARGVAARAVAFTSSDPAADVIRLARMPDVASVLVDGAGGSAPDGPLAPWLHRVLAEAPCDVAILANTGAEAADAAAPVVVPFGGADHEWAAAELAAWIARAEGRPLRLLGAAASSDAGRRDATRLLASVALLVQQVAGVETTPALVAPGAADAAASAAGARAVVVGMPDDWARRGLGGTRADLARRAAAPVLLVRGGPRPGGLAPAESVTRFTWTLSDDVR